MGMTIPHEVASALSLIGFTWPEGDEEKLFAMGGHWTGFAETLRGHTGDFSQHARQVWENNQGEGVAAFERAWNAHDAPQNNINDAATTYELIGAGLMVCAGIVLALKINVIVQVTILIIEIAQAIATAIATFGASLLEIPIFRAITKFLLDQLLNLCINQVMNG